MSLILFLGGGLEQYFTICIFHRTIIITLNNEYLLNQVIVKLEIKGLFKGLGHRVQEIV